METWICFQNFEELKWNEGVDLFGIVLCAKPSSVHRHCREVGLSLSREIIKVVIAGKKKKFSSESIKTYWKVLEMFQSAPQNMQTNSVWKVI